MDPSALASDPRTDTPPRMLFSRNKPQWLYTALPALYLLGGILAITGLRSAWGLGTEKLSEAQIAYALADVTHLNRAYSAGCLDYLSEDAEPSKPSFAAWFALLWSLFRRGP